MAAAPVKLHLLPARLLSGGAVLIKPRAETTRGAGLFWGTSAKGGKLRHLVVGRYCTQPR